MHKHVPLPDSHHNAVLRSWDRAGDDASDRIRLAGYSLRRGEKDLDLAKPMQTQHRVRASHAQGCWRARRWGGGAVGAPSRS